MQLLFSNNSRIILFFLKFVRLFLLCFFISAWVVSNSIKAFSDFFFSPLFLQLPFVNKGIGINAALAAFMPRKFIDKKDNNTIRKAAAPLFGAALNHLLLLKDYLFSRTDYPRLLPTLGIAA